MGVAPAKMHSSRSTLSARSVIAFSLITLADNMINLVAAYGGKKYPSGFTILN